VALGKDEMHGEKHSLKKRRVKRCFHKEDTMAGLSDAVLGIGSAD